MCTVCMYFMHCPQFLELGVYHNYSVCIVSKADLWKKNVIFHLNGLSYPAADNHNFASLPIHSLY